MSVKSPASVCNVVGLRVTVGLISRSGIVPLTSEKGKLDWAAYSSIALRIGLILPCQTRSVR